MKISQLKPYTVGTAVENKALDSKLLEVHPTEVAPMADGELTPTATTYKAAATDSTGAAYNVEVQTTVSIKCEWLPMFGSNRMTPPDIRRGESVIVYRFGDTDKFFWATLFDDMHLRRLETVIYGISGTASNDADLTADNMYFFEWSTHKKIVHLHTSKANGEPFAYDIQINADYGCITITDDAGNYISLDSKERQLEMKNADGSTVNINKKEIFLEAADLISLKAKKITVDGDEMDTTVSTNNLTADTNTQKSTTNTITAQTTHNGMLTIAGALSTKPGNGGDGSASLGGKVTAEDGLTVNGDQTVSGTIKAGLFKGPQVD
jgi:phage baseplate assembly protein gpV